MGGWLVKLKFSNSTTTGLAAVVLNGLIFLSEFLDTPNEDN
jgi:hypothetical protein